MTIKVDNFANTIYGVILNDTKTMATLAPELSAPPYKAPPNAPVIYIKPFNTLNTTGVVQLPDAVEKLEMGTTPRHRFLPKYGGRTDCITFFLFPKA